MFRLIKALKALKNKLYYKLSPEAVKSDIRRIVNQYVLESPLSLIDELDRKEGVIDYKYDSDGNIFIKLASGISIEIKVDIKEIRVEE